MFFKTAVLLIIFFLFCYYFWWISVYCRYPVILSIENHCNIKQQQAMAHYLRTILGDTLYTTQPEQDQAGFPSPEFFKEKILVKVSEDQGRSFSSASTPKLSFFLQPTILYHLLFEEKLIYFSICNTCIYIFLLI